MNQEKKILVLYTGGTIGMERNENNVYSPTKSKFLNFVRRNIPCLHDEQMAKKLKLSTNEFIITIQQTRVRYIIEEYENLIDSCNVSIKEWEQMAQDIENNYSDFDAFIILHGTDTLAYTSSILSFMLDGLSKPVILTGAQKPIFEEGTDAIDNFYWSLYFASLYAIPEVCIFFGNKLLRGNRCKKVNTIEADAFDSPNYPALATISNLAKLRKNLANREHTPLNVRKLLNANVGIFQFTPTTTVRNVESFIKDLNGLVILTYGTGNIPMQEEGLINLLENAIKGGLCIINISQCIEGPVTSDYESGNSLDNIDVIFGNDMTIEAAYAKLVVMLSTSDVGALKILLKQDLKGEMTVNNYNDNNN